MCSRQAPQPIKRSLSTIITTTFLAPIPESEPLISALHSACVICPRQAPQPKVSETTTLSTIFTTTSSYSYPSPSALTSIHDRPGEVHLGENSMAIGCQRLHTSRNFTGLHSCSLLTFAFCSGCVCHVLQAIPSIGGAEAGSWT